MKTSTLMLGLSVIVGAGAAVVLGKPAAIGAALVPWLLWRLWTDEAVFVAALIVSPSYGGAYRISDWTTPYKLLLLLGFSRILVNRLRGTPWRSLPGRAIGWYGLLVLWAIARDFATGLGMPNNFLNDPVSCMLLVFVYSQLTTSARVFDALFVACSITGVLQAIAVAVEIPARMDSNRATGLTGQENLLAVVISLQAPWILAGLLTRTDLRSRLLGILGLMGSIYAVMGSGSRGGGLGFLVGVVAHLATSAQNIGTLFRRLAGTLLVFAVLLPIAPDVFYERVIGSFDPNSELRKSSHDLTSGRAEQYASMQEMIRQRPLEGWGASGYADEWRYGHLGRNTAAHSSLLGMGAQYGVPATLVWLGLMLSGVTGALAIGRRWPAAKSYSSAAGASCLANIAMSLTAPGAFHSALWAPVFFVYVLRARSTEADFAAGYQALPDRRPLGRSGPPVQVRSVPQLP